MRLKIGSFELIIHKRKDRPRWEKVSFEMPKPQRVIDHACYLYDILEDDLHTGDRSAPLPDCKKVISRTLFELGMNERSISETLPWLGDRSTVYSQIRSSKLYTHKTHPRFADILDDMFKKFGVKVAQ